MNWSGDPYREIKEIESLVGRFYRKSGRYPTRVILPYELYERMKNTYYGNTLKEFYYQDHTVIIPDLDIDKIELIADELN